jgi:hypothetical protein
MNNLDFRKIVLKENLTDDDGCAHQEGTAGTDLRNTDLRVRRQRRNTGIAVWWVTKKEGTEWSKANVTQAIKCTHSLTILACSLRFGLWPLQIVLVMSELSGVNYLCVVRMFGACLAVWWHHHGGVHRSARLPGNSPRQGYRLGMAHLEISHPFTSRAERACRCLCELSVIVARF